MTKVTVNLLRDSEMRYQGIVSRQFLITLGLSLVAVALLLVFALSGLRMYSRSQELKMANKAWLDAEPRYKKLLAMQREQAQERALASEMQGWHNSRLELAALLADIRHVVAARPIQFVRLTVSSQIELIQPPVAPPKAAPAPAPVAKKDGEDDLPARPVAVVLGTPARRFRLLLEAKASGEQSYQDVVDFGNDLRTAPALAAVFESVRLQGMRQAAEVKDRPTERLFEIECLMVPRKIE